LSDRLRRGRHAELNEQGEDSGDRLSWQIGPKLSVLVDTLRARERRISLLTVTARLVLFVSAYAPLLALFAILDSFGRGWPSVLCACVAIVSVLALVVFWSLMGRSAGNWITLTSSRSRDGDVMAFFVSYVVPFAAAQDAQVRTRVALGLFAIIIAALYVRSAVFYTHPLLLLAGYHIHEAATAAGVPVVVITRRRYLRQNETIWTCLISPDVYREKGRS
jgi:hypothetical protein